MAERTPEEGADEIMVKVALCREADDMRALHKLVGMQRGEERWTYWEATGVTLGSPVEALLGVCGFAGKQPPRPTVRALGEDDVTCVPLFGFNVPASMYGEVRAAIMDLASGQIGGFSPVVVSQSGFHDAAIDVLSYVWSQVGRPPIWVRSPATETRGGGSTVPEAILSFARRDTSFKASDYLRNLLRVTADGG
jgi:hypothetical protein